MSTFVAMFLTEIWRCYVH